MNSESTWGRISDIAKINPETTNSNWNGREIRYIDIASVGNGVFNSEPELMLYDEAPSRARRVVKHGDVLISTVRPNRRSMIQIMNPVENTIASTGFALLRPKRIEDSDYLFGIICNKQFTLELEMLAYGAAYPAVSTNDICRPSVYLPKEEERDRISMLLRPISNFNQSKISKTIQEYIFALFRSWFIDFDPVKAKSESRMPFGMVEEIAALFPDSFEDSELGQIPAGWRVGTISEFGKIVTGRTPSSKNPEHFGGPVPFVTIPDLGRKIWQDDTERTISQAGVEALKSALIPANSVCVSCIATVGNVGITTRPSITNQQIHSIVCDKGYSSSFVYSLMVSFVPNLKLFAGGGAVVQNISKSMFGKQRVIIPPIQLVEKFTELVEQLHQNINVLNSTSRSLIATRDTLLLRLMSGELKVN